jgi:hypothetical protein
MRDVIGLILCGIGFTIATLGFKISKDRGKKILIQELSKISQVINKEEIPRNPLDQNKWM